MLIRARGSGFPESQPVISILDIFQLIFVFFVDVLWDTFGMSWGGLGFSLVPSGVRWGPRYLLMGCGHILGGSMCQKLVFV